MSQNEQKSQSIILGNTNEIKLDGLSPETIEALRKDYAKGLIDVNTYAVKLGVETHALAAALRNMAEETRAASKENISMTATRVQTDTLGKTEVIMGNTETAKQGKLTRSQSGLPDNTLAYAIIVGIVIVVLALLFK